MATDYGTDLSCVSDMDPLGAEVSGRLCLGQNLARRLQTPRGRLIYDGQYGFDLTAYLNADVSPSDLAQLGHQVATELVKDQRVVSAAATVTLDAEGALTATCTIVDGAGPFPLVLTVSNVTPAILSVG